MLMGIRSMVGICIKGPKDKLEFLRKQAIDFFNISDLSEEEELAKCYSEGYYDSDYYLRWYNNWIKWYTEKADASKEQQQFSEFWEQQQFSEIWEQQQFSEFWEQQQFKEFWSLADKWGLDGKCIEYCYKCPGENDTLIINNGNDLPYPLLSITILMN